MINNFSQNEPKMINTKIVDDKYSKLKKEFERRLRNLLEEACLSGMRGQTLGDKVDNLEIKDFCNFILKALEDREKEIIKEMIKQNNWQLEENIWLKKEYFEVVDVFLKNKLKSLNLLTLDNRKE